jgi:hypothetical protein
MSTNSRKALANYILRCDPLDKASKLLALDFYFDDMSSALDVSSQAGIVSSLHLFHEYSLLMRDCALEKAPLDSPWFCTLFQIERDGEEVRTMPGTFVYEGSMRRRFATTRGLGTVGNALRCRCRSTIFPKILTVYSGNDSTPAYWRRTASRRAYQSLIRVSRSLSIGPVVWIIRPPTTSMKAGLIKESGSICSR